jgi:hypothetical protein
MIERREREEREKEGRRRDIERNVSVDQINVRPL